jgi:uncharacterized protein YukE
MMSFESCEIVLECSANPLELSAKPWHMCHVRSRFRFHTNGEIEMAKKNTTDHETRLRAAFKTMSGDEYQTIRDAYYKAVEGLQTFADALERAVAPTGDEVDPMLAEHLIACSALNAMDSSELGRIL